MLYTLRKKVEPIWLHHRAVFENCATLFGGAVFSLIVKFREKRLQSCTFEGGAKIVPWMELSYAPSNSSRVRAILAPLFFSVYLGPFCRRAYYALKVPI